MSQAQSFYETLDQIQELAKPQLAVSGWNLRRSIRDQATESFMVQGWATVHCFADGSALAVRRNDRGDFVLRLTVLDEKQITWLRALKLENVKGKAANV